MTHLPSCSGALKGNVLTTDVLMLTVGGASGRTLLPAQEHVEEEYNTGQEHVQTHRECIHVAYIIM